MRCPYCSSNDDKVIDSRATDEGRAIRRRRQCLGCQRRYTTYEYVEERTRLTVIKKDGSRVPYDRQKVLTGLEKSCYKRPVSAQTIQKIVDDVEEELFRGHEREVEAIEIGRAVADKLKHVDQVAYVRFASVYKQFRDLDDFLEEVREMLASGTPDSPNQGWLFSGMKE
jgi:transcriptional repressor NrdR